MLCVPETDGRGVLYAKPGQTAKEAWENGLKAVKDIPGFSRDYLTKRGYEAKKVEIFLKEEA